MNILKRLYLSGERRNQSLIILPALSLLLGVLVVSGGRSASHARDAFVRTGTETAAASDCLRYDPRSLRIVSEGSRGWLLTDGVSRMHMLDNRRDAERALALTRRHMGHCFIGRDNTRPSRMDYIVEYWSGGSGIPTVINGEDCISYNPRSLRIVYEGANGWLLTDGRSRMLMLDNREDAAQAWNLARSNSRQCFIGRDNTRPDRKNYILGYWR
jgi:hypothetical protein